MTNQTHLGRHFHGAGSDQCATPGADDFECGWLHLHL